MSPYRGRWLKGTIHVNSRPSPCHAGGSDFISVNILSVTQRGFRTAVETATRPFVLLAAVHLSVLWLQLPVITSLPGWFFGLKPKPLGPWYLIVSLAAVPFAGQAIVHRLRARPVLALCVLVLLGFALQHGFAWSEGHGLDGMRNRIVTTGHAEFAAIAVQQESMWDVLVGYEGKLQRNELGRYCALQAAGTTLVLYGHRAPGKRPVAAGGDGCPGPPGGDPHPGGRRVAAAVLSGPVSALFRAP